MNVITYLQKLELELQTREPKVATVLKSGDKLIKQKHFAKKDIKEKRDYLDSEWKKLLILADERQINIGKSNDKYSVGKSY